MFKLMALMIFIGKIISTKTTALEMYNRFFENVRKRLAEEKGSAEVLMAFEQSFYSTFNDKLNSITSSTINIDVSSEISTIVNAYKYDETLGTYAYGSEKDNKFLKVLISGAKGSKSSGNTKQIATLALSEIVEMNQSANAIVYASKISDTQYVLDAKVNDAEGQAEINNKGQYIFCKSIGHRYIFDSLKTALAITKMFRLAIGSDYIKFDVSILMAGAGVRSAGVVSKSTIQVQSYVITKDDYQVKENSGYFISDNMTDDQKSVSNHFALIRIQKSKDAMMNSKASGSAVADSKNTQVSGFLLDFLTRK